MKGNIVTKKYMSDNEKFADLFNYILYDGHPMIHPEELRDCDGEEMLMKENMEGAVIVKDKLRDIKKSWIFKSDDRALYVLLGIENQERVHYAMPVRNMVYDALEYESQVQTYARQHRKTGDLRGDGFISGISKEDKLIPVITLVVYLGANRWDGPRTLHEMFDIKDERILQYVNDYKLNLIEPAAIEDTTKFQSDFRYVMDFIKHSKDKEKLKEMLEKNKEFFSRVPYETAMLIKHCADVDVRVKEEKEETNMCKAIEDMKEEAREEGRKEMCKAIEDMKEEAREEGREEGRKEMCKAIEDMKEEAREEGRKEMCKAIEDMKEEAREEGREEIRRELEKERVEICKKMLNKLSVPDIVELGYEEAFVLKIAKEIGAC